MKRGPRSWVDIPTLEGGPATRRDIDSFLQLQKMMGDVGKDVKAEMRFVARELMKPTVQDAQNRATMKLQKKVARSIKPEFFKGLPSITSGGRTKMQLSNGRGGTHEVWAGEVFAGAEFGSNGGKHAGRKTRSGKFVRSKASRGSVRQFPPRTPRAGRGNAGYFFYPAIRENINEKQLLKEYYRIVGAIFRKYGI